MARKSKARVGSTSGNAMNPLPSLLRASAWDAAARNARENGRRAWNEEDYDLAVSEQERLVRACYCGPDDADPRLCYIRFGIAEQWQKAGHIGIYDDWAAVMREIETCLAGGSEPAPALEGTAP